MAEIPEKPARFFDAHTHAHFAAYEKDWREVIGRALQAGVWMINVGTQRDTSARAVEIANLYPEGVYATVGLHPIHTEQSYHNAKELGANGVKEFTSRGETFDYEYYKKLALDPKCVGIGECGLDYYRLNVTGDKGQETWKRQKKTFEAQIELAKEVQKPLMIHCREAFKDLIDILVSCHMSHVPNPGVIHFFTGTPDDAKKLLDLGFAFTFGGVITFARDYDAAIKLIPLDRILSETDAPYVSPVPYRGKRNEPAYVVEVVKKLAELKGISEEQMAEHIFQNAKKIFKI
jgi:TatD DNase family protein